MEKGDPGAPPPEIKNYTFKICVKPILILGLILDVLRCCHSLGLQGDCFKTDCFVLVLKRRDLLKFCSWNAI